jgi:AraC-like DNA-binding protein
MLDSAEFVNSSHQTCLYAAAGRRLIRHASCARIEHALLVSRASAGRARFFAAVSRDTTDRSDALERSLTYVMSTESPGLVLLHVTAITGRSLTLVRRLGRNDGAPVVIATGLEQGETELAAMRRMATDALHMWLTQARDAGDDDGRQRSAEAAPDHHAISILAHTCGRPDVSATAFLACAEAIRRLKSAPLEVPFGGLSFVIRDMLERPPDPNANASDLRVRTIIDALQCGTNAALRRSLSDWARLLGVDAAHLGRLVHAQTGLQHREWRRVYRMKRAAHLLTRDDEQVAQIAFAVGFNDNSQFGREFRELFGFTPRTFRSLFRAPRGVKARQMTRA